jgi:hypothetical protein
VTPDERETVQGLLAAYAHAARLVISEWSGDISKDRKELQTTVDEYAQALGLDAPRVTEEWDHDANETP